MENLTEWVREADQNGDQKLSKSEWDALMNRDFPDVSADERQRWSDRDFTDYDTNNDGFVEANELAALSLGGFDCHDINGDGRLSHVEITAMPQKGCPARVIESQ